MRKLWLSKDDFELFYHEIGPYDYEFFRTHLDTFKRMWREQRSRFWDVFILTFEDFMWTHGSLKDFPMCISGEDVRHLVAKVFDYVREQFVKGKVSTAKNFILHAALVAQNKHALGLLDKVNTSQNPFYVKETREAFRSLFGEPSAKDTYVKLVLGLPLYLKFAGAIVIALRRWLSADDIDEDNQVEMNKYFVTIHTLPTRTPGTEQSDEDRVLTAKAKAIAKKNKGSIETKGSVQDSPAQREKEALSRDQVESKDIIEPRQDSSLEPAVDDHPVPSLDQEQKKIVKLHICATCQKKEETVKTFKRCQRCKGKPNPRYYCNKECQAADWKGGHREYHIHEDALRGVQ